MVDAPTFEIQIATTAVNTTASVQPFPSFADGEHIRVIEIGNHLSFPRESLLVALQCQRLTEYFQRNFSIQRNLLRQIDDPYPTSTDLPLDTKVPTWISLGMTT